MNTESSASGNLPDERITEHEGALLASPRRDSDETSFRVVDFNKKSRQAGSPIARFPNGRLGDNPC